MLHKNQQVCYGCSCKFTYTSNMYLHYGPRTYITGSEYTKPRRIAQNRPVDYGLYTVCGIWGMYRIMDLRVAPVCVPAHALSIRVCYALWLATRLRKLGRSHLENPRGDWFGSPASSLSLSFSLYLSIYLSLSLIPDVSSKNRKSRVLESKSGGSILFIFASKDISSFPLRVNSFDDLYNHFWSGWFCEVSDVLHNFDFVSNLDGIPRFDSQTILFNLEFRKCILPKFFKCFDWFLFITNFFYINISSLLRLIFLAISFLNVPFVFSSKYIEGKSLVTSRDSSMFNELRIEFINLSVNTKIC